MPENTVQVYATHRRWDPWYHFFAFSVVSISFFVALWTFIKSLSGGFSVPWAGWNVVAWAAAIALTLRIRSYPLKLQDRIIRLEERLRLAALLDDPLRVAHRRARRSGSSSGCASPRTPRCPGS